MVKHKLNMYVWVLGITTISLLSVSDTAVAEEGKLQRLKIMKTVFAQCCHLGRARSKL